MRHVQDNAEESVRRVITKLRDGAFTLPLDNGARISVAIRVDAEARSATIDFTGTSAQLENNFNAPTAVCMAAVLYVFRTLVDDEIPLNAGCLKPLEVIIPEGSMLNPRPPASVVAGNVETSTCITNTLYGALGVMASAQCTMNNFTFGNARHQYYETIAGGSGAGLTFDGEGRAVGGFAGTSVVQTHMTNSRLTDPEVLEFRFPVRLDSFAIRAGSGGARSLARRRRRRPARPLPRADDGVDPVERPPCRRLRHGRRRGRAAGRQPGRARRRHASSRSTTSPASRCRPATCSSSRRPAAAVAARPEPPGLPLLAAGLKSGDTRPMNRFASPPRTRRRVRARRRFPARSPRNRR